MEEVKREGPRPVERGVRIHQITPGTDLDERGFQPPPRKVRGSKYKFAMMEVGDFFSVSVPFGESNSADRRASMANALRLAARRYGKDLGKKFVTRETSNGARIWRSR